MSDCCKTLNAQKWVPLEENYSTLTVEYNTRVLSPAWWVRQVIHINFFQIITLATMAAYTWPIMSVQLPAL